MGESKLTQLNAINFVSWIEGISWTGRTRRFLVGREDIKTIVEGSVDSSVFFDIGFCIRKMSDLTGDNSKLSQLVSNLSLDVLRRALCVFQLAFQFIETVAETILNEVDIARPGNRLALTPALDIPEDRS